MDGHTLRNVMGHFTTGVAVVTTTTHDNEPYGLTVNSLTSLSLDPPLILVCLDRGLGGLQLFQKGTGFSVNVLSDAQQEVSTLFAKRGITNRFDAISWHSGPTGSPSLDGALAVLDCDVENVLPGGDHVIVVGRVNDARANTEGSNPLVFYKGKYTAIPVA